MIRNILMGGLVVLLLSGVYSCREKVPLSKEKFTSLLLDMHRVDGTLSVNRSSGGKHDLKNYAYYNDLFRKYGIHGLSLIRVCIIIRPRRLLSLRCMI